MEETEKNTIDSEAGPGGGEWWWGAGGGTCHHWCMIWQQVVVEPVEDGQIVVNKARPKGHIRTYVRSIKY